MSHRINLLDEDTASKIAAGEVVEKPASVVKELVENSLDAQASQITVEILNGGLDLIRVMDNGHGLYNDDLQRAFLPHATSKIARIEDLFSASSLGFRGEALASVASVSKTLLKSHAREEEDGMEIFMEGGEEKFCKFSSIDQGTIVEVKDLFYNVPARRKFLKTPQTESSKITDIMTRLALSAPSVAFTYYNNEKRLLTTRGSGDLLEVIGQVYNRKTAANVSYFEQDYDTYRISGYIGNEAIARGSRNQESIFLNGRYIESRQMAIAVEQAFKSFITIHKFPFFVLNIELDPLEVDINVHPQKAQVKFADERLLFRSIFDTVHQALRKSYQGNLGFEEGLVSPVLGEDFRQKRDQRPLSETPFIREEGPSRNSSDSYRQDFQGESQNPGAFTGTNPRDKMGAADDISTDYKQEGFLPPLPEVRLPVDLKGSGLTQDAPSTSDSTGNITASKGQAGGDREASSWPITEEPKDPIKFPMPRIIGAYDNTYILSELAGSLYLIDQHAAHEKINFEHYMDQLEEGDLLTQPLLVPQVLDLSIDDFSVYSENQEVFAQAGFDLEFFGDRSLNLRQVPLFLAGAKAEHYFTEILDNLKNLGRGSSREVRYLRIATAACKASIKAHDELSLAEMEHLVRELSQLKEPFTCPHGRPTMIRFTKTEVEKLFRRIQ